MRMDLAELRRRIFQAFTGIVVPWTFSSDWNRRVTSIEPWFSISLFAIVPIIALGSSAFGALLVWNSLQEKWHSQEKAALVAAACFFLIFVGGWIVFDPVVIVTWGLRSGQRIMKRRVSRA